MYVCGCGCVHEIRNMEPFILQLSLKSSIVVLNEGWFLVRVHLQGLIKDKFQINYKVVFSSGWSFMRVSLTYVVESL